jgi:hypothetical protein
MGGNGCSLKTATYVQNALYGNPNGPQGSGASQGIGQCCSNAFNLCFYRGDENSQNFANVQLVTFRACSKVGVPSNRDAVCNFYNEPTNCGSPGLRGNPVTSSPVRGPAKTSSPTGGGGNAKTTSPTRTKTTSPNNGGGGNTKTESPHKSTGDGGNSKTESPHKSTGMGGR